MVSRATPPQIRTVSPKFCGAGSRVKTRGAGLHRVLLGRDDVGGATLQQGTRRKGWLWPRRTQADPKTPKPQMGGLPVAPQTGCGAAPPAASMPRWEHPNRVRGCLESPGTPTAPQNEHLQPQTTSPRPPPPQNPVPHLSGDVVGSLGRRVGDLGGDHHHLGRGWIDMCGGAGPGRRVALHAGRAGGRLGPVLVEMLRGGGDKLRGGHNLRTRHRHPLTP